MSKYIKNTHLKKGISPLLLLSTLTLAGDCDKKPSHDRNKVGPGPVHQTPPPTPPGEGTGKANPTPPPQKTLSVPGIVPPEGTENKTPPPLLTTQYDTKNIQVIPYIENPILGKLSSHHSPSGITLSPQFLEFNNKWNQSLFLEELRNSIQKKQEQLNQKQKKEEKEEEQQQKQQQQYSRNNSSNTAETEANAAKYKVIEKATEARKAECKALKAADEVTKAVQAVDEAITAAKKAANEGEEA